jgi:ABC-type branched-subunit amino acid transport system ATPase component
VRENVRIAVQSRAGVGLDLLRLWSRRRDLLDEADELVGRVNLAGQADSTAGSLSHGDQRKLEVAIMLALRPQVFMFDEPTAGMSVDDVPVILDLIHAIKATGRGPSFSSSTRWTWSARSPTASSSSTTVSSWRTGSRPRSSPRRSSRKPISEWRVPEPLLSLQGVHTHVGPYHILQGVDLVVPRGGLTALLGRNGAGKTSTLRTIMGLWHASAGEVRFGGRAITAAATPHIAQSGIAYVPENMSIFADLTVRENLVLAARTGPMDPSRLEWILQLFPALKTFWSSRPDSCPAARSRCSRSPGP